MTDLTPLRSNHLGVNEKGSPTVMTPEGTEFEFTTEWLARFQDSEGKWLDQEAWPKVEAIFVCNTSGCPAEGKQGLVILGENPDGIFRASCGYCQNAPSLYEA